MCIWTQPCWSMKIEIGKNTSQHVVFPSLCTRWPCGLLRVPAFSTPDTPLCKTPLLTSGNQIAHEVSSHMIYIFYSSHTLLILHHVFEWVIYTLYWDTHQACTHQACMFIQNHCEIQTDSPHLTSNNVTSNVITQSWHHSHNVFQHCVLTLCER